MWVKSITQPINPQIGPINDSSRPVDPLGGHGLPWITELHVWETVLGLIPALVLTTEIQQYVETDKPSF